MRGEGKDGKGGRDGVCDAGGGRLDPLFTQGLGGTEAGYDGNRPTAESLRAMAGLTDGDCVRVGTDE